MQAIETKLLPTTAKKPTRIRARCERGSIIVSADSLSGDQANGSESTHVKAANLLALKFAKEDFKKYGSPIESNPWTWPRVVGGTKEGFAHVYTGAKA